MDKPRGRGRARPILPDTPNPVAQPSGSQHPTCPAQPSGSQPPTWPAQSSGSQVPAWPAQPSGPQVPTWPVQPSAAQTPTWPAQPSNFPVPAQQPPLRPVGRQSVQRPLQTPGLDRPIAGQPIVSGRGDVPLEGQFARMNLKQGSDTLATRGGGQTLNRRRVLITGYSKEFVMEESQFPASDKRYGTQGRIDKINTNYCGFSSIPGEWTVYMYDVNFSPAIKEKTVVERYRLLLQLQSRNAFPRCAIAYDGRCLFTPQLLSEEDSFLIQAYEGANISFRKITTIAPDTDQWYRVINVVFNLCQQLLGQKKYGNDFFLPPSNDVGRIPRENPVDDFRPQRFKLGNDFEVLQGFGTTLHRVQGPRNAIPLILVSSIHRLANLNTVCGMLNNNVSPTSIIERTVLTRYNNRTYIVSDVMKNVNIDDTFDTTDGKVSYREYYAKRYNIQLQFGRQPFLKLKLPRVDRMKRMRILKLKGADAAQKEVQHDILIPSELCFLTGFSEQDKARYQRDAAFATICRKAPAQRFEDVNRFYDFLYSSKESSELLKSWNLQLKREPLSVEARVLDICFDPKQRFRDSASLNNRALKVKKPANRPSNVITLAIIQSGPRVPMQVLQNYAQALSTEASKIDFKIQWSQIISGPNPLAEKLMQARSQNVDIVLIGLDDQQKYKEIKTTCIEHGILSQVVRVPTMNKTQTAQKVALQMACKVGFTPWTLARGLPQPHDGYMIVGIDTFAGKGASIVQASVFSLNTEFSKYYTHVKQAKGRNLEAHIGIDEAFKQALKAYLSNNGTLPSRIFVYRDGVGDSQLFTIQETEINPIKDAISSIYGSKPYHLVITVVKKRISQRFFLCRNGQVQNVAPGTIVDKGIVKPSWFEYYIVPQDAGQGTATPTNYNVVFNNKPKVGDQFYLPPDDLQKTTFALTHLYFNWNGTIRVPAPVQYAHKCAFLLGQCSITSMIHRNIEQNLFYL